MAARITRIIAGLVLIITLTGCAAYKFSYQDSDPTDLGYVVSRDGLVIREYACGEKNTAADMQIAKERFRRRKAKVEDFYKKMDIIENRFKMLFVGPSISFLHLLKGIFRLPAVAIAEYKYDHDPQDRQRVDRQADIEDELEIQRIDKLKKELDAYIVSELSREKY